MKAGESNAGRLVRGADRFPLRPFGANFVHQEECSETRITLGGETMLISFRVSNFRSIRDEQELSLLVPTKVAHSEFMERAGHTGWNTMITPVVGIFGANASGKSNVLDALRFMRRIALDRKSSSGPPADGIPVDPFRLDRLGAKQPSGFEVELRLSGVRYQYGFKVKPDRVISEWLYAWPHGRRQTWFERDNASGDGEYYFGKSFTGRNQTIAELTRPDRLFLTSAADNNHPLLQEIRGWFLSRVISFSAASNAPWRRRLRGDDDPVVSDRMVQLLKLADLGISGVQIVEEAWDDGQISLGDYQWHRGSEIALEHSVGDDDAIALPFHSESHGTQVWFALADRILHALRRGALLLVDELDAGLHPHLAAEVIKIFQNPSVNTNQAQLIFNAHDTSLLGNLLGDQPLLRRDQVWFTEKDARGATHLYPLSDFKPRKLENLERGYLQGRYGAVPVLREEVLDDLAARKSG